MADSPQEESLAKINAQLRETLVLVSGINKAAERRGDSRIEQNLETELRRTRLTTNEAE
ncbi:MAG: hypothetical protein HYY46_11915 [Deltaproteobacteria bacterium]|nr:hypothetical protein [Deltaproteobacteria bacterium]